MSTKIMLRRVDHPAPNGLPPPEIKVVTSWRVSCDGGEGALGHPRVWMEIPRDLGFTDCGYCDARFVHKTFSSPAQEAATHPYPETPGIVDHATTADLRGDVRSNQPGDSPNDDTPEAYRDGPGETGGKG